VWGASAPLHFNFVLITQHAPKSEL